MKLCNERRSALFKYLQAEPYYELELELKASVQHIVLSQKLLPTEPADIILELDRISYQHNVPIGRPSSECRLFAGRT